MSLFFKPSAQTTSVITNGLVSRYTFEDTGDTSTLTDVAGTNHMTINGMAYATDSTGRPTAVTGDNYGDFDGVDDDSTFPETGVFDPTDAWTMVVWVRIDTLPDEQYMMLVHPRDESDVSWAVDGGTFVSDGEVYVNSYDGSSNVAGTATTMTADEWTLLGLTHDGAGGFSLYQRGSGDATPTTADADLAVPNNPNETNAIASKTDIDQYYLDGGVDDLRFYSRELSTSEFGDIYNGDG